MKHLLVGLSLLLSGAEPAGIRVAITPAAQRKAAPAFSLANAAKTPTPLSRYRGKVVLLDFWATECGGCKVEIPWFMEFERAYKAKGLEVVGVSMDVQYESLKDAAEGWSRVKPWVQAHHVNYPVLMADDDVVRRYGITALPITYLLDRQGRVAAEYGGLVDRDDVERNIEILLKEPR